MSKRKGTSIAWLIWRIRKFSRARSYFIGTGYISLYDRNGKHVASIYTNGVVETDAAF